MRKIAIIGFITGIIVSASVLVGSTETVLGKDFAPNAAHATAHSIDNIDRSTLHVQHGLEDPNE